MLAELSEGQSVSISSRVERRSLCNFLDWKASGSSLLNLLPCLRVFWREMASPSY